MYGLRILSGEGCPDLGDCEVIAGEKADETEGNKCDYDKYRNNG